MGPWLEHDAVLEVITAWPTPADLSQAFHNIHHDTK